MPITISFQSSSPPRVYNLAESSRSPPVPRSTPNTAAANCNHALHGHAPCMPHALLFLSSPESRLLCHSLLRHDTVRISRLPESFGTPVTWSAAELSELQYPHLEQEVKEQRKEWKGFHSSLKASSKGCGVTEEELSWAMGVAYSRAFR